MAAQIEGYSLEDAVGYHYGQFPPESLDFERVVAPLGRASTALARYDAILSGLHNKDLLLAPLRRQEAVITSRIEGTIATIDEILSFEADVQEEDFDEKARVSYRQEVFEVQSYVRALGHAQRLVSDGVPICGRLIREAHSRMLFVGRGADKRPGEFKKDQNYVVDRKSKRVLFVPITAEELQKGFLIFEEYVNNDATEPLIQAALAHVEFEALHPFADGNGRIGRMLITLMLWNRGLISGPHFYISGYLEDHRDEYIERMRAVSSDGAWTEWCIFFLAALEAQAVENYKITLKIGELYDEMKGLFTDMLASKWSISALDFIFAKPVFRNSLFTSASGIPKPTAARFTKVLSDKGLLTTILPAAGRRSAVFAFEPLLRIVRT